jgi:PAS domain S-box-containing protein
MPTKPTYEKLEQRVRELEEEAGLRRQIQIELKQNEARFRTLFEKAHAAIVIVDAETGKIVEVNTNTLRLFELTREELIGSSPADFSPPMQPNGCASKYGVEKKIQELSSGKSKPFEWIHKNASGKEIPCEIYLERLSVSDRKLFYGIMIDITERRRTETKLRQFQHIVESMNNPVGLVDRNLIYRYANEPYSDALNKPIHKIIGHSVPELFGQTFFKTVMENHYNRCFSGENVNYQEWFDFPGWGLCYMDVCYYPYKESDDQVTGVVINVHDITELKQVETKLNESEERFRAFMENIPAVVYIKDKEDRHIYTNPEGYKSIGRKPDEFIGATTRDLWPPELADKLIALDKKVIDGGIPRIVEEWESTEVGSAKWRRDIKFPIRLESGETILGGIAFDISDIKNSEKQLRTAYERIDQLKQKLEQENIYLREEIELRHQHEEIIGKSGPVMEMLTGAEQVAATDATVLILGETGTGKELLANEIHRLSRRKDSTMIKVNCAALPATLIESELFGREKGAYTGAMSRQLGRFEIADGSTLFLDEIGEIPLQLQTKLLRVLQEGQFERLGSPNTITTDVRIITSTNRDLAKAVREGSFREDLYYRLNVFSITVPPLRDRIEDIPLLVWAFVKAFESSMGKTILKISKKSLDALAKYAWPGNIRELKNVVENAMIITKGETLYLNTPLDPSVTAKKALKLEDVERNHIKDVLKKTSWRVSGKNGAAELLGLKPTTLESRMKKLGITRPI